MPTPETELILRALDDVRDDLAAYRRETRAELSVVFTRLDETRQLVARLDERTKPVPVGAAAKAGALVKQHAPAAGVASVVVALLEYAPALIKVLSGGG